MLVTAHQLLYFGTACLCLWSFIEVTPLQLTSITPEHAHIRVTPSNVTILCEADGPLSRCQFRWRNEIRRKNGPTVELSEGAQSATNPAHLSRDVTWYEYSGAGLDAGQCGITLRLRGVKQYTVACRVRSTDSGWQARHMTLYAESYAPVSLTVSPTQLVEPDTELSVMCKAETKLSTCHFRLPGFGLAILDAGLDAPSPPSHRYHGEGLASGDCGITLASVQEASNGLLWCLVESKLTDLEWRTIPIIVKRPPDDLVMQVLTDEPRAGATFRATCTVRGSRPASSITWYLGERVLRSDDVEDDPSAAWTWPYQPQSLTQTINITLREEDHGREVTCVAEHPSLAAPLVATRVIHLGSTKCSVLVSGAVDFACVLEDEPVNCSLLMDIGTRAHLSCKPGYVLNNDPGYNDIQCQPDGTWDKPILNCIPDTQCSILESEVVGIVCVLEEQLVNCSNAMSIGTKAHLSCKPGYTPMTDPGYSDIQCQLDGTWDKPLFNCVPDSPCSMLESEAVDIVCVSEEKLVNCSHAMEVGTRAHLGCKSGYILKTDPGYSDIQCQPGGAWDKPVLECVPDTHCSMLESEAVDIMCISEEQFVNCSNAMNIGTKAHLSCKPGYILNNDPGYSHMQCQQDGSWDKPLLDCVPGPNNTTNHLEEQGGDHQPRE